MEDIPHSAFHSFLVEPPQGRQRLRKELSEADIEAAEEAVEQEEEDANQKKRGIDWSQGRMNRRASERRRQKIA